MSQGAAFSPLFTDLYEITMAAGYHAHGMNQRATFSVYVRGSQYRNYYLAAGVVDVVKALAGFHFSDDELAYLESTGRFAADFLVTLAGMTFTGDAVAMPEGTIFFPNEPILEISAPVIEAQMVETFVLNALGLPTMVATKAARCVEAAGGRPIVDFSLRRTQGYDAGMQVARSAYLAGFAGTSNVLAGKQFGIPVSGTMAHSFVTAFASEPEAFAAYARVFPDQTVLLIDTYDVETGARHAVETARSLSDQGHALAGVRLDSGDMAGQSRMVRRIFDDAGFPEVKIFASSSLDEFAIAELIAGGACIDAFGVGTRMGVSADRPYLDIVYKLVHIDGRDVRKTSTGKVILAGEKQVFRRVDADGRLSEDIIGSRREEIPDTIALLRPVLRGGQPVGDPPTLEDARRRAERQRAALPGRYKSLDRPPEFPVRISDALRARQPGPTGP
jgi:nicotinate phosphoribosyltransferase